MLLRRLQTCLRYVLSIMLALCDDQFMMDLHGQRPGCELLLTSHVSAQGSRLLTNRETKRGYIVAPLNQLVDERYTIYWNLAAVSGIGHAIASTAVAAITATLMLAFGCTWWLMQPADEARAEHWPCEVVDNAAATSGRDMHGRASGSLTHTKMASSTSAITPTVAGEVHNTVKQQQPVTSHPSGPLRQRNICASVLSSASENSDAADDAAASCGSFELLAAAE